MRARRLLYAYLLATHTNANVPLPPPSSHALLTRRLFRCLPILPGLLVENVSKGWRPAYIFGLALQPAGSLAATVCSDGMLRLWNTAANALEFVGQRAVSRGMVTACAWDSAGKRLAVACKDGSVSILVSRTKVGFEAPELPSWHSCAAARAVSLCDVACCC